MKTWKLILACILAGSVCVASVTASVISEQRRLSDKLIRLHVIANSDSEEDQQLKMQVKEGILDYLSMQQWSTRDEAVSWINEHLTEIAAAGAQVVTAEGLDYLVQAELGMEEYPLRRYETFSLPAGEYLSLRVSIGQAEGKNWWCVVFPSICRLSGGNFAQVAAAGGFSKNEVTFITEDSIEVKVKFKLLEWLNFLF